MFKSKIQINSWVWRAQSFIRDQTKPYILPSIKQNDNGKTDGKDFILRFGKHFVQHIRKYSFLMTFGFSNNLRVHLAVKFRAVLLSG